MANDFTYNLSDHANRNKAAHFDWPLLHAVLEKYRPESLTDLGAGAGWYCRAAADAGVRFVFGIEKTPEINRISEFPVMVADLATHEFHPPEGHQFDLALCLEVAQYIAEERVDNLLANCCRASSRIIWSAAHPGQPCPGGVTFLPEAHWACRFRARQYEVNMNATGELRAAARLPWLKENLLVLERDK